MWITSKALVASLLLPMVYDVCRGEKKVSQWMHLAKWESIGRRKCKITNDLGLGRFFPLGKIGNLSANHSS